MYKNRLFRYINLARPCSSRDTDNDFGILLSKSKSIEKLVGQMLKIYIVESNF
jgi:hypothetical protein